MFKPPTHTKFLTGPFDFIAAPTDPLHLFVLLKDVRTSLRQASPQAGETE